MSHTNAVPSPVAGPSEARGLVLGLIGVVIFGLTLPATRIAVAELDPVFVGLGRAIVAAGLAIVTLAIMRPPLPRGKEWWRLAVTSAGVVIGFPLFASLAMLYAPASHGGVILAILPLATAVASVIIAGERPSMGFWLCSIAGSATVLVFAWADGVGQSEVHWADLLLVAAIICAAIGYAQGGVLSRTLGGWQVICWCLVVALPVLVPVVALWAGPINWDASRDAWLGFLYVAICSQFLGFFAWNSGLAIGGVAKIGQLQLLQPFITLLGAAVLIGETITMLQIAFALAVVALVALGRRMRVSQS